MALYYGDTNYLQADEGYYPESKLSPMTGQKRWLYGIWEDLPTKFPTSLAETNRLAKTFSLVQFLWLAFTIATFCLCSWRVLWWTPPRNKQVIRLFKFPADEIQPTIACCTATSSIIQYCKVFWAEKLGSEVNQINVTLINGVHVM